MRAVKLPSVIKKKEPRTSPASAVSAEKLRASSPSLPESPSSQPLIENPSAQTATESMDTRPDSHRAPLVPRLLYGMACLLALLFFFGSILYVNYFLHGSVVCEVSLDGERVGYAESNAALLEAVQDFESELSAELGYSFLYDGELSYRLVPGRHALTTPAQWHDIFYESLGNDYVQGVGMLVDNQLLAILPDEKTGQTVLSKILNEKNTLLAGENESIELRSAVTYEKKLCRTDALIGEDTLYLLLTEGDESLADLRETLLENSRPANSIGASGGESGEAGNLHSVPTYGNTLNSSSNTHPSSNNFDIVDSPDSIESTNPDIPADSPSSVPDTPKQPGAVFPGNTIPGSAVSNIETGSKHLSFKTVSLATEEVTEAYEVVYVETDELYEGMEQLLQAGLNGQRTDIVRLELADGKLLSKSVLISHRELEAREEVILVGTKPRAATGNFHWPLRGLITSTVGNRDLFGSTEMHLGTDIDGHIGDEILASDGGVVTFAGWHDSYGYLTIIDHENGYETYYAHQSKLLVSEGDRIYQDQIIGLVGDTGRVTGPHLHFELRKDGIVIDPFALLRAGEET